MLVNRKVDREKGGCVFEHVIFLFKRYKSKQVVITDGYFTIRIQKTIK